MAIEAELPDGRVLEFPDGTDPRVIQATVKRVLGVQGESSVGTVGGFFRGLVPGAVSAVESAATGASALLPESLEKPVRETIRSTAEAARRPFAGVPGEEGTILRRFGEATGSIGPYLALGPFGVAGRAGMVGLGVASGAGEARVRAEEGGATPEQRSSATALGAAVGSTEALPIFAFLNRLGTGGAGILSMLRRAAVTGGQEGAQEAAANVAQNLISKGLYNPEQGVFTDTGESLGYGAGVGALVSALTDLVLGKRARGTRGPEDREETPPAVEPTPEAPSTEVESLAARAPTDLSVGELYQEEARLSSLLDEGRQPKEVVDRIREIRKLKREYNISAAEDAILQRTAREQEQARAAQSVFSEETLPEVVPREGFTPPQAITPELLLEAGLPAEPTTAKQKGVAKWFADNIVGRTVEEVQERINREKSLVEGNGLRAKILRELTTVTPKPFEEKEIGRLDDAGVPESAIPELGGDQPSVGLPSGVGDVEGAPATPGAPSAPVDRGVEAAALPAQPGDGPESREPVAVVQPQAAAPASEMPLKPGLAPEQVQELRAQLADVRSRMSETEAERDRAERAMALAEMTGNQEAAQTAFNEHERARAALKSLATEGGRTYRKLYDMSAVEAQEAEGARLQAEDAAAQQARREANVGKNLNEIQGAYPYNLKTVEAVHDELRDNISQTPEYKAFIEKNFTPTRKLKAGKNPDEVVREGQKLLDRMVFQEGVQGEVPLAQSVRDELDQNSVADALHELSKTTTNPLYVQVARRLMRLLGDTNVIIEDDLRNTEGKPAAGAASLNGRMIWLDRNRGMNEETLLHESVHAASEFVLSRKPADRTAEQNAAVRELDALWEAAKADPDITLSPDAQANLSEFVTEALTNPALIKDLQAKPWTFRNAWESFKRTLLKMLGIKSPSTMNEAAIAAMDTIFQPSSMSPGGPGTGKRFQLAPNVEAALKSQDVRQVLSVGAAIKGAFRQGLGLPGAVNSDIVSTESKIRTFVSDKAATVFDKLGAAVNKGMMSAMDSTKIKSLFKQSEAADQLIPEFLRKGKLALDPTTGLWKVSARASKNAPVKALEMVEAWGKKNGMKSFEDSWEDAARLIESGRQYEFRRQNALAKPGDPQLPVTKGFPIDVLYPAYKSDADLQAIKKILDEVRIDLIDNMVSVGRLSAQEGAAWKAAAEYVPFDRLEQFGEKIRQQKRTGRGIAALGKLPELVDASLVDRPVGNALENYFKTLGWMVEQTVRTDALNKTLAQLQAIGEAKAPVRTKDQIQNPTLAVRGFRNGDEIWYEVPTIYHAAAFNAQTGPLPKFLEVFGTVSRILRTSITALPTFTASQLPQDIQRAIIYSGVKNPAALTAKALSNFSVLSKHALKGTLYEGAPIQSAFGVVGDVDFRKNDPAQSILEELGFVARKTLGSKKAGTVLHRLNELARASDIAIRKAIYEQTLEETKDELLALQRAREIINFRSTGSGDPLGILPVMIQTIPFFNAYIQGTDVLYRALTGSGAVSGLARRQALGQFYKMAGALAAGSTVYALMMAGDDEYENMNLDERDRSWVLGGGFSIPVPSEIGMVFKAIPERVVEAMLKEGTPDEKAGMIAISSWFRAAFMEYAGRTVPIPAATKPILEAWTGYSFRTGRQMEGVFQEGLDASRRATSNTSEFAKEVARFASKTLGLEISPIKIDNTLNGYFGTTAALTLAATDGLINPDRADRPLHQLVGLTPFTYDPVGNRRISEFYDLREKVVSSQNTLNLLMKQDLGRAREYVEENRPRLLAYKAVNETLKQLQVTRQYKQWLDTPTAAEQMSSEERMKKKQEIQAMEQRIVGWVRMARKELDL